MFWKGVKKFAGDSPEQEILQQAGVSVLKLFSSLSPNGENKLECLFLVADLSFVKYLLERIRLSVDKYSPGLAPALPHK